MAISHQHAGKSFRRSIYFRYNSPIDLYHLPYFTHLSFFLETTTRVKVVPFVINVSRSYHSIILSKSRKEDPPVIVDLYHWRVTFRRDSH